MMEAKGCQISFRVDDTFAAQIEAAALVEELALADFVRKVFKHGFAEYQKLGSLHALRNGIVARQTAIERRVYERHKSTTPKKKGNGGVA